jgi:hypothetical protein
MRKNSPILYGIVSLMTQTIMKYQNGISDTMFGFIFFTPEKHSEKLSELNNISVQLTKRMNLVQRKACN